MAESITTRFGLKRWTADSDTPDRTDFDSAHLEIATNVAGWLPDDTLANRPAAAASNARFIFRATDTGALFYSTGSAWEELGAGVAVQASAPSSPEVGDLWVDTDDTSIAVTTSHNSLNDLGVGDPHPQYAEILNDLGDVAGTPSENDVLKFDGTSWSPGRALDVQKFTSSGTWTKPAGAVLVEVLALGAGGGGGGGGGDMLSASGGNSPAGGGGGGGGGYGTFRFLAEELSATESVTVGAGGSAGTGGADSNTGSFDGNAGSSGSAGGNTSFGTSFTVTGGGGGGGGTMSSNATSGSGGSGNDTDVAGGAGGAGNNNAAGSAGSNAAGPTAGAGGGAGGSANQSTGYDGGDGGGPAASAGGIGVSGGTTGNDAGDVTNPTVNKSGAGGGGGTSNNGGSSTTTAGDGGVGGLGSGGGGGGGAKINSAVGSPTARGGNGAIGGSGFLYVISYG